MKTWVGISVVIGLGLILGLGGILFRELRKDFSADSELVLTTDLARRGLEVASSNGCISCHSLNGSESIGPTWKNMYGRTEILDDGTTVVVNDAYIRESILRPNAKIVAGYEKIMLPYPLPQADLDALVEFSKQLSDY